MIRRAVALVQRFAAANGAFIQTIDIIPEEAWGARDPATGWSVAATAHHIAARHELYMGIANAIAHGEPIPEISQAMLDRINAEHAAEHHDARKRETLVLLLESGEKVQRAITSLTDDQLDATASLAFMGDDPVSAQHFVEETVIGHITEHLSSLRAVAEVHG